MLLDPKREIDVNTLIREYLRYADYKSTANAFDSECGIRGRVPEGDSISAQEDPEATTRLEEVVNRFIIAFHDGDRKEFFKFWDQHFPPHIVKTDPLYQKIEFQVSIYFAVFPIHPFVSPTSAKNHKIQSTMDGFKQFLETRGAELCKTTQFLSYYALPYVPDARAHPSFNEIFTERHVRDLESRLKSFLGSALRAAHVPRILRILSGVDMRPADDAEASKREIKALKQQLYEADENERDLQSKHRGLQQDYHNLLTIASELVQTLAACINGETITASYLSSICQRVSAFKKNSASRKTHHVDLTDGRQEQRHTSQPQSLHNTKQRNTPATAVASHIRGESNLAESFHDTREGSQSAMDPAVLNNLEEYIDYGMVLRDLKQMGDDEISRRQAFVLQALRMRLTNTPNLAERRKILHLYLNNDVLGVISGHDAIVPLIRSAPHVVCEQISRLLNTIASECIGRDYILAAASAASGDATGGITSALVEALMVETRDSLCQQNLLGTLQKLSLRRSAQTTMNSLHVLEFLHTLLEHSDSLSDYSCEYGAALFMNLCLRTEGRKQCRQHPRRTLETLLGLLAIDSMQVQTYVNGALYSLLSEPDMRQCAIELRLNESLMFLQKSANEQVKGQINFVLEQIYSNDHNGDDAVSEDGADEDEEEDDDEQEPEEDFDQLIPTLPHDKAGTEALLPYCVSTPHRNKTSQSIRRTGTGGLAGSSHIDRLRHSGTASVKSLAARDDMRRPKTPTSRSTTPAPITAKLPWPKDTNAASSMSKAEGLPTKTNKRAPGNVPVTETEIREFNTGFTTRPKLARTPIN